MIKQSNKILILRFSSIGDLVLTTPVVRAINQQLAGCEIHFLTKKKFVNILAHNPYITKIHTFENNIQEVIAQLKLENFDLIIDLHKNLRSFILKKQLAVKSISYDKINFEKWLMVKLKINRLPEKHIVDRYFDALVPLSVENDNQGLDYFLENNGRQIKALPDSFPEKYVVFSLAGTYITKKIPLQKWKEMAALSPLPIVLLGGDNEKEMGEVLEKEFKKQTIFNACGLISLNQSAAVISDAQLIITGDTGLMHIAAAFKKKIVSLWGNTIPEFGMYPYFPQNQNLSIVIENKNLKCRPCSKLGFDSCPEKHFNCMMQLDVSNVFRQI